MGVSCESKGRKKPLVPNCHGTPGKMSFQKLYYCLWLCLIALYWGADITSVLAWAERSGDNPTQTWSNHQYYQTPNEEAQFRNEYYQRRRNPDVTQGITDERYSAQQARLYQQDHAAQGRFPAYAGSSRLSENPGNFRRNQRSSDHGVNEPNRNSGKQRRTQQSTSSRAGESYQDAIARKSGQPHQEASNTGYNTVTADERNDNFMEPPSAPLPVCTTFPDRPVDFVFTLNPQSTMSYLNVSRDLTEKHIPKLVRQIARQFPNSRFGAATFGHIHAEGCFNASVPLTYDVQEFIRMMREKIQISFGGRSPELSLMGSVMAGTSPDLGWTNGDKFVDSRIRVVLLTTDDVSDLPSYEDDQSEFMQMLGDSRDSCYVRLPSAWRVGSLLERDNWFVIVMPSGRNKLRETWNSYAASANYLGINRMVVAPLDVNRLSSVVTRFLKTFRVVQCIHHTEVQKRLKLRNEMLAARRETVTPTEDPQQQAWLHHDLALRKARSGYLSSTWVTNNNATEPASPSEQPTVKEEERKNRVKPVETTPTPVVVSPVATPKMHETVPTKATPNPPQSPTVSQQSPTVSQVKEEVNPPHFPIVVSPKSIPTVAPGVVTKTPKRRHPATPQVKKRAPPHRSPVAVSLPEAPTVAPNVDTKTPNLEPAATKQHKKKAPPHSIPVVVSLPEAPTVAPSVVTKTPNLEPAATPQHKRKAPPHSSIPVVVSVPKPPIIAFNGTINPPNPKPPTTPQVKERIPGVGSSPRAPTVTRKETVKPSNSQPSIIPLVEEKAMPHRIPVVASPPQPRTVAPNGTVKPSNPTSPDTPRIEGKATGPTTSGSSAETPKKRETFAPKTSTAPGTLVSISRVKETVKPSTPVVVSSAETQRKPTVLASTTTTTTTTRTTAHPPKPTPVAQVERGTVEEGGAPTEKPEIFAPEPSPRPPKPTTTSTIFTTAKSTTTTSTTKPTGAGSSARSTEAESTSTTTTAAAASGSQAGKIAAVSSAGAAVVAAVGGVLGYTKLFNKPPVPEMDFGEGMDVPQTEEVERDLVAGVNFA